MKITVFGASGMVGKQVVRKALALDHDITAFGRNVESMIDADLRNEKFTVIKGYLFEEAEVYHALKNSDAVISVLGGASDGSDKVRSLGMKIIVQQMEKAGVNRIVALGGLGILNADDTGKMLIDEPDYPKQYLAVGKEHLRAYEYLKDSTLNWTFVCSPDIVDGYGDGMYITNLNFPPVPNSYKINSGNLALFMVDEAAKNNYIKQRVGIANT